MRNIKIHRFLPKNKSVPSWQSHTTADTSKHLPGTAGARGCGHRDAQDIAHFEETASDLFMPDQTLPGNFAWSYIFGTSSKLEGHSGLTLKKGK